MSSPLSTHYDRIPQRHREDPAALESARAAHISAVRAAAFDPDRVSLALTDPTLLRDARMEHFTIEPDRILIDLAFNFPDEEDERLAHYGGPARIIAGPDPSYRCSGTEPAEPDPEDEIVWSELRSVTEAGERQAELVLVCASGRHWAVRAGRIHFASISLPC
jgi:hypothetical protein